MLSVRMRLRAMRKARGLSQRQLAACSGVSLNRLSALERGMTAGTTFWTLARLCEALKCAPGDLFEALEVEREVPILAAEDEDDIIRWRRAQDRDRVDGPTFIEELMSAHPAASARRRASRR